MSRISVDKIIIELNNEEAIHIGCAVARELPSKDSEQGKQAYNSKMRQTVIQLLSIAYGYDATNLVDTYSSKEQL